MLFSHPQLPPSIPSWIDVYGLARAVTGVWLLLIGPCLHTENWKFKMYPLHKYIPMRGSPIHCKYTRYPTWYDLTADGNWVNWVQVRTFISFLPKISSIDTPFISMSCNTMCLRSEHQHCQVCQAVPRKGSQAQAQLVLVRGTSYYRLIAFRQSAFVHQDLILYEATWWGSRHLSSEIHFCTYTNR